MLVLFTPAEKKGGILQFSKTFFHTSLNLGIDVKLFVPESVIDDELTSFGNKIIPYKKIKTVNLYNFEIKNIVDRIVQLSPTVFIGLEDSILVQQIVIRLHKSGIRTSFVVHDVVAHPYFTLTGREIIVELLRRNYTRLALNKATSVIVLSNNSAKGFLRRYPMDSRKIQILRLGAHVPYCDPIELKELNGEKQFFLFFGRIDKYKGIDRLVSAYSKIITNKKLVIAGKGNIPENIKTMIDVNKDIIFINRFIEDGELKYLYENCSVVVLPYIEASQSGVLPIAYYYTKPVIVSNLPGLTENVVESRTGLIFNNQSELEESLSTIDNRISLSYIQSFYKENYDWECNVKKLLFELGTL